MRQAKKIGNLVYDVGMHKGEDTDFYLKKGFNVIAFEADPDLARHCRNRFSQEIESGRLIIVEGAIIETRLSEGPNQTVKFYKSKGLSVWGTVVKDWAQRNEFLGTSNEVIEVPAINFVQCLEQFGIPHYLKIDIEGLDTVCLEGLLAFNERPSYVSIESEKTNFAKLIEELKLFTQLGYTEFKAVQQNNISCQVEPNPSSEGVYLGYRFLYGSSGLFGKDLPGKWKSYRQIVNEYRFIFLLYKLFGDYGKLKRFNRYFEGRKGKRIFSFLFGKTIGFWCDTHAKHRSVTV